MESYPLAQHRRRAMLTVRELAQLAGIAHSTVYLIEHGKSKPRIHAMRMISAVLKVDPKSIAEFDLAPMAEGANDGKTRFPERGKRVQKLRDQKNWSVYDLAAEVGVHPNTVRKWESGYVVMGIATFSRLADALDTTMDYLWKGTLS